LTAPAWTGHRRRPRSATAHVGQQRRTVRRPPALEPNWPNNSGLKLPILIPGTQQESFSDQQVILPQLVHAGLQPATQAQAAIGTIDPTHSLDMQRHYLDSFFTGAFAGNDITAAVTGR
jgi:hypothetical protein